MRSDADPPAASPEAELTTARRLAAACAALLALVLVTGITASPLLVALVALVASLIRYEPRREAAAAPLAVLVALVGGEVVAGGLDLRAALVALLAAAGTAPGLFWRREARRTSRQLARLDDIMAQARRGRDAEAPDAADELEFLERALSAAALRIGARGIVLWAVDPRDGKARSVAATGRVLRNPSVRLSGDPLGWAWENGIRMRMEQPPAWLHEGCAAVVDRLRRAGDSGELLAFAFAPGEIPADDVVFDEAALYIRGLMELQGAQRNASADRRRLRTLLHGLSRTPGELDIESFAPELCGVAADLVEGTGAAIGFWHGDHGTVLACVGEDEGPNRGDIFTAPGAELGLAIRADAMLVRSADSWALGRTHMAHANERWKNRPRAMAALPLRTVHGAIGVLAVWTSRDRELDPGLLELLHMLEPYAAIHLQHAVQYGTIKESAERDPLTLLRNRRAFENTFAAETSRFERYGRPLSLLVLDLDHFKGVNDRYGHEAGDEVLRRTARIIHNTVRDVDTAARLGGEEFVVLMPETSLESALDAGERIRAAIEAVHIEWRGTVIPVSVSVGVSSAPEIVAAPADLMKSADAALYAAKEAGRNRVATGARVQGA